MYFVSIIFGLGTLYTTVNPISLTHMVLEKYYFEELKGAYLGSFTKILIVYSNKVKKKLLLRRQEAEVFKKIVILFMMSLLFIYIRL